VGGGRAPFTFHFSRLLRIRRRQRHPALDLAVEGDLEGILSWAGKGNIEHQDRPGLDIDYAGGRLAELDRAFTTQQLGAVLVYKADPDRMNPDLGSPPPHSQDQVRPGADGWEVGDPDMLKDAEHTQLALLVDEGIIGDEREIEMQLSLPVWK
jgi:hypothetical protein